MKTLRLLTPEHKEFRRTCSFANSLYTSSLRVTTRTAPQLLLACTEHQDTFGCIGFNHSVTWHFFTEDPRYQSAIQALPPGTKIGEQSIFALQSFPAGVPLLISALAAYAEHVGIEKIVFAGIAVSLHTIHQLGYVINNLGPTAEAITTAVDRRRYQYWVNTFNPQTCVLDTAGARSIYQDVLSRFAKKAHPDQRLQSYLTA